MGQEKIEIALSAKARAFSVENLIKYENVSEESHEKLLVRNGISVELCSNELWDKFNDIGTEMIVTKAGRRMFPTLKLRFFGLSPSTSYVVFMDVVPVGNTRYRYVYHSSKWTTAGVRDSSNARNRIYIHPDSPATGQLWTSQGHVSFDKVKLTNNKSPLVRGQISLHSMHKYQPRVHILEVPDFFSVPSDRLLDYVLENRRRSSTFVFSQTSFITVTAYQNQEITRLKIRSNPFAKGFRVPCHQRDKSRKNSPSWLLSPDVTSCGCILPYKVPVKIIIPPQGWASETITSSHA